MADRFWLLVADASRAQIYAGRSPVAKLREVQAFDHPEGRAQARDLVTDRPGRRSDDATAHLSALDRNVKDREEEMFAKELSDFVDSEHTQHRFEHLSIVAPPSMLGHLRDKLPSRVRDAVLEEVAKTVTHQPISEIRDHLSRLHPA